MGHFTSRINLSANLAKTVRDRSFFYFKGRCMSYVTLGEFVYLYLVYDNLSNHKKIV
jgi:hypothetical protein